MKRLLLLSLLVFSGAVRLSFAQYFAVSGNCELPGQAVVVSGIAQAGTQPLSGTPFTAGTGVMASYPQCLVTVYPANSGAPVPAGNVYSDAAGDSLGNPFTANTDGSWVFYVAAACYDVVISSGTGPASQLPITKTLSGLCAGSGGGGGSGNVSGPPPPSVAGDFALFADTTARAIYDGGTPGTFAYLDAAAPGVGFGTITPVPSSYFVQLSMAGSVLCSILGGCDLGNSITAAFSTGYFFNGVSIGNTGVLSFVQIGTVPSTRGAGISADLTALNTLDVGDGGSGDFSGAVNASKYCISLSNCITTWPGGGGSSVWSALTFPTSPLTMYLTNTGTATGVPETTTFTVGDFVTYGSGAAPCAWCITDVSTAATDLTPDLGINTGNNSYHPPLYVALTTGGVTYPQLQVCNTNGASHVGITVIGNKIPCLSLPTAAGTQTLSGASKFWVIDGTGGHTQATFYQDASGSNATMIQGVTAASGTGFNFQDFCSGVTSYGSGGNGTCIGSGMTHPWIVRGDGLLTTAAGVQITAPFNGLLSAAYNAGGNPPLPSSAWGLLGPAASPSQSWYMQWNGVVPSGSQQWICGTPVGNVSQCGPASTTAAGVSVNGSVISAANFNATTPSADSGYVANTYKVSSSNVISESPTAESQLSGATLTGLLEWFAPTTGGASQNCNPGTAPSAPNAGDVWCTSAGMYEYNGSKTLGPLGVTPHSIAFTTGTPGGSALGTGVIAYYTIPFACSLTGWSIQVDAENASITIKTWKVAAGTSIPTGSNSISTSGVQITTGTVVQSTTLTDFTTTAIAANDIIAADISAISSTNTGYITFQLSCQ